MENKQYIVALEIASSRISAVAAAVDKEKNYTPICFHEVAVKDCVRYGSIVNTVDVCNKVTQVLQAIEKDRKIAPRKIKSVYVGISCRSLHSSPETVEETISEEQPVTEEVMENIRRRVETNYQQADLLGLLPRRFEIDYKEFANPVGVLGSHLSASFNVILCKPQIRKNMSMVLNSIPIRIAGWTVTPLAVAELALSDEERQLGCMLVDHGAETTTVSIYKNDRLMYLAVLPMGSRNITRDLMSLNILEENAEEIKQTFDAFNQRNETTQLEIGGVRAQDVSNYITARTGEIVANIANQLELAGISAENLPSGIIVVGRGAMLRGFIDLLAKSSKMKVRLGNHKEAPNNQEYANRIQLMAILDAASKQMTDEESCMELPEMELPKPDPDADGTDKNRTPHKDESKRVDPPKKPKWWEKIREAMTGGDMDDKIDE